MTSEELHIDLDVQIQKINSNATLNIEPQEKDFLLNQQVLRYLNNVTRDISNLKRKGFEEDTKRLKDIEPLIRTKQIEVETLDEEKGRFFLPSSLFKYVAVRPTFYKDCEEAGISKVNRVFNIFKFTVPRNIPENYRVYIYIQGSATLIFAKDLLPDSYIGDERAYIIKAIFIRLQELELGILKDKDIEWYYEWCGTQYKENTFYFKGASSVLNDADLQFNYGKGLDDGSSTIGFTKFVRVFNTTKAEKTIKRPGRIVSHERLNWMLSSSISNSIPESPLITVDKHYGYAYYPKNIIINEVALTYVCKPHLIDIDLGTSLNLDSDICQEIVINTAKFVKALLDSGNYEKYFNETNLIE